MFPSYILLSVVAAVLFGLDGLLNKFTTKHKINNHNSMMFYFCAFSFIYAFVLLPLVKSLSIPAPAILPLVSLSLAFLAGAYCFYAGIYSTDASSFAPFFQLQTVFIVILAYVFLGERFPVSNYLWITLVLLGAMVVGVEESFKWRAVFHKGFFLLFAMQVLHAFSNLFVGMALNYIDPYQILFWEYLLMGLFLIPFYLMTRPPLNFSLKSLLPLAIASWSSSTGAVFLYKAFETNLTLSSVISLLTAPFVLIVTIIASRFRPDLLEHHTRKVYLVRVLGLVIILVGVLKISLG